MSEPNPNESGGWQMYEVLVIALCASLAMWGMLSGTSAVRAQSIAAKRTGTREKVRESTDAKSEKALTTFAALDTNQIRFRVPLDLALKQAAVKMESNATGFHDLILSRAPDPGRELFVAKLCYTCHQTDPAVPASSGIAMNAPAFMGDFWGKEREVHEGNSVDGEGNPTGPIIKVKLDEAYFLESVEKPMAKIVKGAKPGMAALPTTLEERKMLMEYVKSLSEEK